MNTEKIFKDILIRLSDIYQNEGSQNGSLTAEALSLASNQVFDLKENEDEELSKFFNSFISNDDDISGFINCEDLISSWTCEENECYEVGNETGEFSSFEECESNCTATSIIENNFEVNIYPNPSSNIFNLGNYSTLCRF